MISLSDILTCELSDRNKHSEFHWVKSLCASVYSSEAGERLKDVSRRAAEITERADCVVGIAQRKI